MIQESALQESEFSEKYQELESRFKHQVEKDNEFWESVYLPNAIIPDKEVDYVLIGMEPSLGRWTEKTQRRLSQGSKNFAYSIEDFILHYCIQHYLCSETETYYITDLSKGAMLSKEAGKGRTKRYKSWYKLLKDEIKLVSNKAAKVIAISKPKVYDFLKKSKFGEETGRELFHIPHYSSQNSWYWDKEIRGQESELNKFIASAQVTIDEIRKVADCILDQCKMEDDLRGEIYARLPKQLTESKKKLVFTYKTCFKHIKG